MDTHLASGLRQRVILQQPSLTADTGGGYTRTWADVATLWAEVHPLRGRDITHEIFQDQRMQARITHRVRIRYQGGVSTDMRLLHEGRALYIRAAIDAEERGEALEILAEEGGAA